MRQETSLRVLKYFFRTLYIAVFYAVFSFLWDRFAPLHGTHGGLPFGESVGVSWGLKDLLAFFTSRLGIYIAVPQGKTTFIMVGADDATPYTLSYAGIGIMADIILYWLYRKLRQKLIFPYNRQFLYRNVYSYSRKRWWEL